MVISLTLKSVTVNSALRLRSSKEMWASLMVKLDRFLTIMFLTSMSRLTSSSLGMIVFLDSML